MGERHLNGLALDGVEGELVVLFPAYEVALETLCREGVCLKAVADAVCNALFGTEKRRVKTVVVNAAYTFYAAKRFELFQERVDGVVVFHGYAQVADGLFEQDVLWQVDVTFAKTRFLQHVHDGCLETHGTVFRDSDLHRDFVGFQEADAPDFFAEYIGVLGNLCDGVFGVLVPQTPCDAACDAVVAQEQHRFAATAVQLPCSEEILDLLGGKTLDFCLAEKVGMVVEDVGGVFAEHLHYGLGCFLADSLEESRGEIFGNVVVLGGHNLEAVALELAPVLGMVTPFAFHLERFARP